MYAPQARPGALDSARRSSGDASKLKQVRSWGSVLLQCISDALLAQSTYQSGRMGHSGSCSNFLPVN